MSIFKFKQFEVNQTNSAMKIGTDSMVFGALVMVENKENALDIGTGTGVLSLMLAQRNPKLKIKAVEIEANAFEEAEYNFKNATFKNQISIEHVDFWEFKSTSKFDLIFSNPPYFENASKSKNNQKNLARHDDSLPLNLLFEKVAFLLSNNGVFWIILPHLTFDTYLKNATINGLYLQKQIDIFGKENQLVRKIGAFSKINVPTDFAKLIVRKGDGNYTDAYKEITSEYHLNELK